MLEVIRMIVFLPQQYIGIKPIPLSSPVLIRPAKAEGEIWLSRFQYFIKRPFQQSLSVEPIMIVAKPVDTIRLRQPCLRLANFRQAEIIKPEIRGQMWLIMTPEQRFCRNYIPPFCESFTPPSIILRNRMELRQVESN